MQRTSLAIAGVIPGDVLHNAYGYGLFTGGLGLHFGGELLGATVVPASGGNTAFQLQLMEDLGAGALCATPSFCMLLGERAAEAGLHERLSVRTAILGAEPWSEGMRQKLHTLWGDGFQAADIYGLSEVMGPGVAQESPGSPGSLQIFGALDRMIEDLAARNAYAVVGTDDIHEIRRVDMDRNG